MKLSMVLGPNSYEHYNYHTRRLTRPWSPTTDSSIHNIGTNPKSGKADIAIGTFKSNEHHFHNPPRPTSPNNCLVACGGTGNTEPSI